MMEVKHSPSSQMDFRTATNGLPIEDDDEEMDTLLDSGAVKSIPISSCDSAPIQNGIKYSHIDEGMEVDFMEGEDNEDHNTSDGHTENKKENEETEATEATKKGEDLDLFDLDLEQAVVTTDKKVTNGRTTDAANVRDTGDDLDTLLSKINDLVEDCMEPSTNVDSSTAVANEKNISEDVQDAADEEVIEELSSIKRNIETSLEVELVTEEEATAEVSETKSVGSVSEENIYEVNEADIEIAEEEEEEEAAEEVEDHGTEEAADETLDKVKSERADKKISTEDVSKTEKDVVKRNVSEAVEKTRKSSYDISTANTDDYIVCLDSPMPEDKEDGKLVISEEHDEVTSVPWIPEDENVKQVEPVVNEIPAEKKHLEKKVVPNKAVSKNDNTSLGTAEEDDDVFLIEDDDECIKETEFSKLKDADEPKTSKKQSISQEEEIFEKSKPAKQKEKKTEDIPAKEQSSETKDEDDIVCLDDSFEEKSTEYVPRTLVGKIIYSLNMCLTNNSEDSTVDEDLNAKESGNEEKNDENQEAKKATDKTVESSSADGIKAVDQTEDSIANSSEKTVKASDININKLTETVTVVTNILETEIMKSKNISKETPRKSLIDSDVITLDDDDDDEAPIAEKKTEQNSTEDSNKKMSNLISDNSDNARDGVEEKDDKNESKTTEKKFIHTSEMNSNSSSNLLKESAVTQRDDSQSEQSEQPPAKKIRLSQDETSSRTSNVSREDNSSKVIEDDDVLEVVDNDEEENKSLKRVHSSELIASNIKKPKTDLDRAKIEEDKVPELLEEIIPAKVETVKVEEKVDQKPNDVKPLPLYPPPNFDAPQIGLSLDFLRRFKKSIHKMNKSDLEELVLQKIVEVIVHKSEFSEMRELIEKQEKIISGHRTKITELNKQFRDLEMVHNRVLKDLETKNSQFIMPVKITRAVGLQVFFPNKKYDQPMASLPNSNTMPAPSSSSSARSGGASSTHSIPDKASNSNTTNVNNSGPLTSVQTPTSGVTNQQRRGCVQKLTPMRPDGPRSATANRTIATGVVSSSTPSPLSHKESPKILNRQILPKPRLPTTSTAANISNSSLPQQAHNVHSLPSQADPERPKSQQGIVTKKTSGVLKNFPPSKRIPKSWQSEQPVSAQPSPTPTPTTSSPMAPPISTVGNSPLAAKPPTKSVIDLTDEDDAVPSASPKTPIATAATQKPVNNTGGHRVGPYKVSVIPAAQLQQQQTRPNIQKSTPTRPQNSSQLQSKANGTVQNAVRRTPPPVNNPRYRHPAPLPNQPIHSSNPLWKLPPARPTIRISNLESGIVISWTIEDTTKEKYAESTSYQIYAYQETSGPPLVESWRHVGDVKAMLLPMAVTLTQFQEGQRYYFAVRAVDAHNRCGPFSFAKTWS